MVVEVVVDNFAINLYLRIWNGIMGGTLQSVSQLVPLGYWLGTLFNCGARAPRHRHWHKLHSFRMITILH